MEAKDTVMTEDIINLAHICLISGSYQGTPQRLEALGFLVAERQAEISFKAGIKEVVEWLEANCDHTYEYAYGQWTFTVKDFNAKLKEWGIEK